MPEVLISPRQAELVFAYVAKAIRSNVPLGDCAADAHDTSIAIEAFRQQAQEWARLAATPPEPKPLNDK